jgi:hypothetical protein
LQASEPTKSHLKSPLYRYRYRRHVAWNLLDYRCLQLAAREIHLMSNQTRLTNRIAGDTRNGLGAV